MNIVITDGHVVPSQRALGKRQTLRAREYVDYSRQQYFCIWMAGIVGCGGDFYPYWVEFLLYTRRINEESLGKYRIRHGRIDQSAFIHRHAEDTFGKMWYIENKSTPECAKFIQDVRVEFVHWLLELYSYKF